MTPWQFSGQAGSPERLRASCTTKDAVIAQLGITPETSVWTDKGALTDRLMDHPLVREAEISRKVPNGLVVTVRERQPIALAPTLKLVRPNTRAKNDGTGPLATPSSFVSTLMAETTPGSVTSTEESNTSVMRSQLPSVMSLTGRLTDDVEIAPFSLNEPYAIN